MAEILKRACMVLAGFAIMAGEALASQGPGVANGTATVPEQIGLGVGVFAALLTALILASRSKR